MAAEAVATAVVWWVLKRTTEVVAVMVLAKQGAEVMGVAASEVEATVVVVSEAVVMEVAAMAEAETA